MKRSNDLIRMPPSVVHGIPWYHKICELRLTIHEHDETVTLEYEEDSHPRENYNSVGRRSVLSACRARQGLPTTSERAFYASRRSILDALVSTGREKFATNGRKNKCMHCLRLMPVASMWSLARR